MSLKPDDYYETPWEIFDSLDKEFLFQWDACATAENTQVATQGLRKGYFDEKDDALSQYWRCYATRIWCNPPYSKGNKDKFIVKAAEEAKHGVTTVMLIPSKTSTIAFHKYIYKQPNVEIRFLKGRPKFLLNGVPAKSSGRNDLMIVIFRG